jgi:hypothetical protein
VDARVQEFVDAVRNSKVVITFTMIEESETSADDVTEMPTTRRVEGRPDSSSEESEEGLTILAGDNPALGLTGGDESDAGPAAEAESSPGQPKVPRKPAAKAQTRSKKKTAIRRK